MQGKEKQLLRVVCKRGTCNASSLRQMGSLSFQNTNPIWASGSQKRVQNVTCAVLDCGGGSARGEACVLSPLCSALPPRMEHLPLITINIGIKFSFAHVRASERSNREGAEPKKEVFCRGRGRCSGEFSELAEAPVEPTETLA